MLSEKIKKELKGLEIILEDGSLKGCKVYHEAVESFILSKCKEVAKEVIDLASIEFAKRITTFPNENKPKRYYPRSLINWLKTNFPEKFYNTDRIDAEIKQQRKENKKLNDFIDKKAKTNFPDVEGAVEKAKKEFPHINELN